MPYYSWKFVVVFLLTPLILLGLFAWKKPRFAPINLVISLIVDMVCYRQDLFYYESRPVLLFFMGVQFIIVAVLIFIMRTIMDK